jgi:hypothetical protein
MCNIRAVGDARDYDAEMESQRKGKIRRRVTASTVKME